jgi:predicted DNA-binding transcriptional regulator YafY
VATDRLERLVNLVAALLEASRPLTRDQLRERVPGYADEEAAFRRTFERDKESLRQMGIPISVELLDPSTPDSPEGYRVRREHYELPDPGLKPDELAALHLAASAVQLEGLTGTEALWKLGGEGADADADDAGPTVALPGSEELAVLFGAIAERRIVRFAYKAEDREVNPYRLSFRNGHWYLAGHDHGRGGERVYRLDRFETAPVAVTEPGAFERPEQAGGPPPHPWELGDENPVDANVLVDADQAGWVVSEVGEVAVADRRWDGSVVVTLRVSNRAAFRSFVLGFLEHAEVLGPPDFRADMVDWLTELAGTAGAS